VRSAEAFSRALGQLDPIEFKGGTTELAKLFCEDERVACVAMSLDDLLVTNEMGGVVELLFEENEKVLIEAASHLFGRPSFDDAPLSAGRVRSALSLLRGEKRSQYDPDVISQTVGQRPHQFDETMHEAGGGSGSGIVRMGGAQMAPAHETEAAPARKDDAGNEKARGKRPLQEADAAEGKLDEPVGSAPTAHSSKRVVPPPEESHADSGAPRRTLTAESMPDGEVPEKPSHAHLYEPGGVFAEMPAEFRAPPPRGSQHLVGQLNASLGIERGLVNPDGSVKLMSASELLARQQASEAKEGERQQTTKGP